MTQLPKKCTLFVKYFDIAEFSEYYNLLKMYRFKKSALDLEKKDKIKLSKNDL